jgi:hypothetical protein
LNWAATVMSPCGVVNCKAIGPQGPLLTNLVTELVTQGSVGGVGSNPGPYPAVNPAMAHRLTIEDLWRRVTDLDRSAHVRGTGLSKSNR